MPLDFFFFYLDWVSDIGANSMLASELDHFICFPVQ